MRDDRDAWLAAGQALERVLLVATRAGYTASYLNQPIETAGLRAHLRHMLGLHGEPQLLLRVGRGRRTRRAARSTKSFRDARRRCLSDPDEEKS